ncbi:MAG: hypothetical protein D6782_01930 [Alphaproteobacteria bacterium]|nr:MAG: hypothetical protein D6782_01930 [Alphaproteobacteria bacterium]
MPVTIIRILIFLLPFVLFALWLYWRRRGGGAAGRKLEARADRRLLYAMLAFILAVLGIATFEVISKPAPGPDARYVPPRLIDGKVVPGYFEDAEEAPQ